MSMVRGAGCSVHITMMGLTSGRELGRRKAESGKRKAERGKRKEERGKVTWCEDQSCRTLRLLETPRDQIIMMSRMME